MPALATLPGVSLAADIAKPAAHKLKISLNAYSFHSLLSKGSMNLDQLLEFCAGTPIEAIDLTGYYFPGYPAVPADDYIYHIKRKAFRLGLDISGTGVRTDFTVTDKDKRKADVQMVKDWIVCASKLGAPVIRIFSGLQQPAGYSWEQTAEMMMESVSECVEYGKTYGVIVGIQNHDDFIKTAAQVHKICAMNTSEWFGIILDIGSYHTGDPYAQIAETAKYAVNWQIKENVWVNGKEQATDLAKVIRIVKESGYRGYLPVETLGAGDPRQKVPVFVEKVRQALYG